ncbi:hypothetical protein LEP1GSC060_0396 [Leptospira weilii serovar Ranarum str. ICFT]|uniref:Uncharacterized protein n=1 Tax=Leptospira weilii serovar Ranarum str. ICFT TaxID=1218598 RepID=N1WK70_9LEPT|nr:hypothetical protein [Leptospira weilii]EMY77752.1 hypothetical protein LEP1GSC060_0396 [Leptospira weilii serovar Ranarum str. ICFT]
MKELMNQYKRKNLFRIIGIFAFAFFLTQCLGHHFTIPKEKVESDIKKVLVLPVYMPKNFVPNYFPKEPNFQPNVEESGEYVEIIQSAGSFLTNLATNILRKGAYEFQTVQYTEDILKGNANFEKIAKTIINEKPTELQTDVYFPKKEFIQKIAKKYQVDAVFYHILYIQYKKSRRFDLGGRSYVKLPAFSILYEPLMYSSNGDLIYNSDEVSYEIGSLHYPETTNEDNVFKASKISNNSLREDLSKGSIYGKLIIMGLNQKY